jgi:hypothetical protein
MTQDELISPLAKKYYFQPKVIFSVPALINASHGPFENHRHAACQMSCVHPSTPVWLDISGYICLEQTGCGCSMTRSACGTTD